MTTPITINLTKSNINFSIDKLLQEWGCGKYDWGDFISFPHFSRFGYNIFTMPSEEDIITFVDKTSGKKNTHILRIVIAYLVLYSQYDNDTINRIAHYLRDSSSVRGHDETEEEWDCLFESCQELLALRRM